MGEIKSTLDLVMERTRHLSLSAEEKETQRRDAFAKRLQGLLQQYADDALSVDEVRKRIADLQSEIDISGPELPAEAVIQRVDPDGDNDGWLALLEHLAPGVYRPLGEILEAYKGKQAALLDSGRQLLADRLAREDGITGSAVAPNPHKDAASRKKLTDLQQVTRTKIAALAG